MLFFIKIIHLNDIPLSSFQKKKKKKQLNLHYLFKKNAKKLN